MGDCGGKSMMGGAIRAGFRLTCWSTRRPGGDSSHVRLRRGGQPYRDRKEQPVEQPGCLRSGFGLNHNPLGAHSAFLHDGTQP
jgi:hypothetical protein